MPWSVNVTRWTVEVTFVGVKLKGFDCWNAKIENQKIDIKDISTEFTLVNLEYNGGLQGGKLNFRILIFYYDLQFFPKIFSLIINNNIKYFSSKYSNLLKYKQIFLNIFQVLFTMTLFTEISYIHESLSFLNLDLS